MARYYKVTGISIAIYISQKTTTSKSTTYGLEIQFKLCANQM